MRACARGMCVRAMASVCTRACVGVCVYVPVTDKRARVSVAVYACVCVHVASRPQRLRTIVLLEGSPPRGRWPGG